MRKLAFVAALLCCVCAFAEEQVTWLSKVHDFGAFDEDTKQKTAYFRFVNTTTEPVSIISATATCGCTTPKYDIAPVEPGDTAVIEVSYDPSGRPGHFDKQVYVRTSDSMDRTKLVIRGTVIGNAETVTARYPVSMGPLKLRSAAAMMGKAYSGKGKVTYIDGYNMSADSIAPTLVYAPDYIDVKIAPTKVPAGEMMSIDVYFDGTRCDQWGVVTDSLMISPDGQSGPYALPLIVIVEEDFSQLTPEQLKAAPEAALNTDKVDIGPVPTGSDVPVNASLTLTNRGKDDLIIRRVYTEDRGLSVSVDKEKVKKGESADIRVTFDPSVQPTGIINARITVITNDPSGATRVVRVVGERN